MVKKFFTCLAWSGLLAVIGLCAILVSPLYFLYSLFSEPWTIEEIDDFKKRIDKMKNKLTNPDADEDWFEDHKEQYDN